MNAPELQNAERAEHHFPREAVGAARRHLVAPDQEVPDTRVDMVVHRAVGRQTGAVAEVRRPAVQKAVEAVPHLGPCPRVAGHQQLADLVLQALDAPLRRARPEIPVAVLAVAVRAERIAEEVEGFAAGIPQRRLR